MHVLYHTSRGITSGMSKTQFRTVWGDIKLILHSENFVSPKFDSGGSLWCNFSKRVISRKAKARVEVADVEELRVCWHQAPCWSSDASRAIW